MSKQAEETFYAGEFSFSYSSLNKLLFSPSLFYKDYILRDREIKTDKYLVEGKLVHCLVFEPEHLNDKFNIVPEKTPTDSTRKILYRVYEKDSTVDIMSADDLILEALKEQNLHQKLNEDSARLKKIQTPEAQIYWKFIANPNVDVIDQETLQRCTEYAEIIKGNKDVISLFESTQTDFDLDPIQTYAEKPLECSLKDRPFGLKGIVDFYKVDDAEKLVTICDLKTTGKSIADFKETIDFYNYWLQAAIYAKLVFENLEESQQDYNFIFKFVVIDKYKQVYVFDVSPETLSAWTQGLEETLKVAEYHYTKRDYTLPYQFLIEKVIL
jgi:hypothetical protein